jgi:hypothetical protein
MKFLTACAKILAGVFAILFIATLLLSLFLFNAQWQFANPELYKRILIEERVYDSLPRLLSVQMAAGLTYNPCEEDPSDCENEGGDISEDDEGGPPDYFKNLDASSWELILREILTADWLQTQTESVIDQFFDFLESDDASPSISISLIELKSKLMGRDGAEIVLKLLDSQPTCSNEQLRDLKEAFASEDSNMDLLSCRPPQEILDEYMASIVENLDEVIGDLPDEAVIGEGFMDEESGESTTSEGEGIQIGNTLRRIMTYLRLSLIVPGVFLLLIAVFGVRSFRDLLRWWGIPLLITGLLALIISVLSMPLFNWFLRTYVEGQIPGYLSQEFIEFGFEVGRSTIRSYVKAVTLQAGGIALVGLVATTISAFIKPRRTELIE